MKAFFVLCILVTGCTQETFFVSQSIAKKAQDIIPPLEEAIKYFKLANQHNQEANLKAENANNLINEANAIIERGNKSSNPNESNQLHANGQKLIKDANKLYEEAKNIQKNSVSYDNKANCLMSLIWASLSSSGLESSEDKKCEGHQFWGKVAWSQWKQQVELQAQTLENLPQPFQDASNLLNQYYPINKEALQLIENANKQIKADKPVLHGTYQRISELKIQAIGVLEKALEILKSLKAENAA